MTDARLADWVEQAFGHRPADPAPFVRALTHSSRPNAANYERLEFLGDRVLGLSVAEWLYERFPDEPEGKLSRRLNALVDGETCAEVARAIGAGAHLRLGKQARDDGAGDSDHVLGDIVESLLGALYLDAGPDVARAAVRRLWADRLDSQGRAPKHPKSALQEWTAEAGAKPPVYALVSRQGPHHAPRFVVAVEVPGRGRREGEGSSKQEAETAAATLLLSELAK